MALLISTQPLSTMVGVQLAPWFIKLLDPGGILPLLMGRENRRESHQPVVETIPVTAGIKASVFQIPDLALSPMVYWSTH